MTMHTERAYMNMHTEGQWIIVVLPRGFVAVGKWHQNGRYVQLQDAAIIRRWGTTAGLGELAEKGPLADTRLDKSPPITFVEAAVVLTHKCSSQWGE